MRGRKLSVLNELKIVKALENGRIIVQDLKIFEVVKFDWIERLPDGRGRIHFRKMKNSPDRALPAIHIEKLYELAAQHGHWHTTNQLGDE